jgi:hypothetical protein
MVRHLETKMRILLFPLGIVAASGVPALAQQQAEDEASVVKERRVCKIMTRVGTRLNGQRVCLTRNEWDQVSWEARRVTREVVDRATAQGGIGEAGKGVSPHGGGGPE